MKRDTRHVPVLMKAVLEALRPEPGKAVVDCTLGLGGHSAELLKRVLPGGRLIATDFDAANIERARVVLETTEGARGRFSLHQGNFAGIDQMLAREGIEKVDALLADLGVASPQIDDPARGFSYRKPGPLDMRMDASRGQAASVLVNRMSERELAKTFLKLGDEEDAVKIARLIVEQRKVAPIETTEALTAIICEARDFTLKRAAGAKLHPAARTFQALRMLVNREIGNLQRLLAIAPAILKPGSGRIAVISFHSGEDRLVKQAFRQGFRAGVYREVSDEPVVATAEETAMNPRSRSAKLRWAVAS